MNLEESTRRKAELLEAYSKKELWWRLSEGLPLDPSVDVGFSWKPLSLEEELKLKPKPRSERHFPTFFDLTTAEFEVSFSDSCIWAELIRRGEVARVSILPFGEAPLGVVLSSFYLIPLEEYLARDEVALARYIKRERSSLVRASSLWPPLGEYHPEKQSSFEVEQEWLEQKEGTPLPLLTSPVARLRREKMKEALTEYIKEDRPKGSLNEVLVLILEKKAHLERCLLESSYNRGCIELFSLQEDLTSLAEASRLSVEQKEELYRV